MKKSQLNILYIVLAIVLLVAVFMWLKNRKRAPQAAPLLLKGPASIPAPLLLKGPAPTETEYWAYTDSEPFFYGDEEYFRHRRRYINLADARAKLSGYIDKLFEYITTFKLILKNVGIDLCSLVGEGSDSIMDYVEDNFPDKLALLVEKIRGIPVIGNKLADIAGNQVDTISAFLAGAVIDLVSKYGDKLKAKIRCK